MTPEGDSGIDGDVCTPDGRGGDVACDEPRVTPRKRRCSSATDDILMLQKRPPSIPSRHYCCCDKLSVVVAHIILELTS